MYRPIPVEEVIAALPKSQQEAIARRGAELVARVKRRMTQALGAEQHDACFLAKAQEALDDPRPGIPQEEAKAHLAKRRATALAKKQR
jgi:ABC-type nitrate/sulfonate/bicarbonate transport system substrate-binding protein